MEPVPVHGKIWAIVLLTIVLSSCEPSADRIIPTGEIVPLKVGNQWTYKVKIFNQSGTVTDSSFETVKIVNELLIVNELWYVDNDGNVQTNRADGRWVRSDVEYLVEKFPCKLNEMYRLVDTVTFVRVKGVDEPVNVPAGRYLTYIYQWMRNGFLVGDFYYSPNLGMVKSEKYMQEGTGVYLLETKELISYALKP